MEGPRLRLREGFRVEEVGREAIVFDVDSGETAHRVAGLGVEVLRLVTSGMSSAEVPEHLRPALADLVAAGIVADPGLWSRRRLLTTGARGALVGGAVWAAATVTTFALADPAAAATQCPPGVTPSDPNGVGKKYTATGTSQYVTRHGQTSVLVRTWGAGGGGGGGRYDGRWRSGGGGGGGAYASATVTVTPCASHTVTVGTGGAGGPKRTNGTGGGQSFFLNASTVKAAGGAGGQQGDDGAGGAGGTTGSSVGTTKYAGGNGGDRGGDTFSGGGGGGGASAGGNGGNGPGGSISGASGGTGGAAGGTITGGAGGNAPYGGPGGNGGAPGGGGGGGAAAMSWFSDVSYSGGTGARGEVWVGI